MSSMGNSPPEPPRPPPLPPNCWRKDYLLFKQIAGPVWPWLQRPPRTSLHFRCLRVPARTSLFSWGISNYLPRTAFGSQGGLPASGSDWPAPLIGQQTCRASSGELMLGWFGRLPGSRTISSNKLNVPQAEVTYTDYGEFKERSLHYK